MFRSTNNDNILEKALSLPNLDIRSKSFNAFGDVMFNRKKSVLDIKPRTTLDELEEQKNKKVVEKYQELKNGRTTSCLQINAGCLKKYISWIVALFNLH